MTNIWQEQERRKRTARGCGIFTGILFFWAIFLGSILTAHLVGACIS